VDLTLGEPFCDAIDELLTPNQTAAEAARNAVLGPDYPGTSADLALCVRYQDDLVSMWDETWPSIRHALIDWRSYVAAGDPDSIAVLNEELGRWEPFAIGYYALVDRLIDWPHFPAGYTEQLQAAANLHAELQDQLALFGAWTSSLRRYQRRTGG
jgi:hypothetical protein